MTLQDQGVPEDPEVLFNVLVRRPASARRRREQVVAEDLAGRRVVSVAIRTGLPTRELSVIDHPQKHHGSACREMLQLLNAASPPRAALARKGRVVSMRRIT